MKMRCLRIQVKKMCQEYKYVSVQLFQMILRGWVLWELSNFLAKKSSVGWLYIHSWSSTLPVDVCCHPGSSFGCTYVEEEEIETLSQVVRAYSRSPKIIMRDKLEIWLLWCHIWEKLCVLDMAHILYWFSRVMPYMKMKNIWEGRDGRMIPRWWLQCWGNSTRTRELM